MARREAETATIRDATHEGKGIADLPGKRVFVAGALAGETVRFQRRKRHRNYDDAELLEVLEPSDSRIPPKCPVFGRCGGCALQHVAIEEQRRLKQQVLADNLERIGRVTPISWLDPLTSGDTWNYRRKARLAVKDVRGKGRVLVGFRERHAPFITDMHACDVLARPLDALIDPLSNLVAGLSVRARLPQIEVAIADNATELVFRVLDPPTARDADRLIEFGRQHDLRISIQPGGPDTVQTLGADLPLDPLSYRLSDFDLDIAFGPTDFVQVNAAVNERMITRAVELLDLTPTTTVLDLYCGIGNFTLALARRAKAVTGVELALPQVERARSNATRNGIENAQFLCADLSAMDGTEPWARAGCDRLLIDPARSGAARPVACAGRLNPERIVYVSCHPGTLARDAGSLVHESGYRLVSAGIVDMFPHTAHVESIAVFERS